MFEFENYCDDSGTDGNSPIAVAACYVSSKTQWDEFVRNWNEVMEVEGFDVFHMAEFVAKPDAGHKPFCNWDNKKKTRVYSKLASIINTRVRTGFGVAIPKAAYDQAAPQYFRDRYANDHYTYAVLCCINLVAEWRAQYGITSPVQHIFDQGSPQTQIKAVWDILGSYKPAAEKFGLAPNGCSFQDKKFFKPLQAADILAWQMRNHMRRVMVEHKDDLSSCHEGFQMLRRDMPIRLGFFTEEQMRNNFRTLEQYEEEYSRPGVPTIIFPKLL